MNIIFWIAVAIGMYLFFGILTALVLMQTPYRDNGLIRNTLFAFAYWIAAIRGMF